jgi:hypothetical protein
MVLSFWIQTPQRERQYSPLQHENLLLDSPARNEANYLNRARLAKAVHAVLGLDLVMQVKAGVEDDNPVNTGEVNAYTTSAR